MLKSKMVVGLLIIYVLFSPLGIAKAEDNDTYLQLSGNKVFFTNTAQTAQWWKGRLIVDESQGFYAEYLQVENYYYQIGAGLEIILLDNSFVQTWSLLGIENYRLFSNQNSFFRTGLRLELPINSAIELDVSTDLMFDDFTGIFPRYYSELQIKKWWLKGNIGIGNLLGSKGSSAIWLGIEF